MNEDPSVTAIVQSVFINGRHGPYAVATCKDNDPLKDPITFSLNGNVWGEDRFPEKGEYVVLNQLTKKSAGWRANKSRFFGLADHQKQKN